MAARYSFRNVGFICGLQNEARCLTAAGINERIAVSGAQTARAEKMAQILLSEGAESLNSIGLAGGLDPRLGPGARARFERGADGQCQTRISYGR